ncbi:DUF4267 domain-containing protein [Streptomyces sp. SBC-4]|nr:DUF4267 domain-containing protein [Streptomyces sp. SBC-4]MDV5143132.1 DUF4267 domain-containing protein [Streptomyces sp. SBC-4]
MPAVDPFGPAPPYDTLTSVAMAMKRLATVLAVLGGLFLLYTGISYLLAPQATAERFGLPTWPQDQGKGFLAVKGMRDIGFGLVILALLLDGQRKALGLAMAPWPSRSATC